MKKTIVSFTIAILILFIFGSFTGCRSDNVLNPKDPVILTVWHNYGGQMKNTMDEMIDEFNETVGAEKGIILSVTSISGSATLHEKLTMAANQDPGAPELPDITTAYPKTALILANNGLLADIGMQFTDEELLAYVSRFLEEGKIKDDKLYVFPTAKSTEVLFVNKTIFNRFAQENNIGFEELGTFEGINRLAAKYYEWTDKQTPEIKSDGKMFFMPDSLFNLTMVGYQQLGDDFLKDDRLNLASPVFSKVWDCFYEPAVRGHAAIFDGYSSDLAKTGDIICALGSTAGVLFYSPTVTYENNITEPVEYVILPYPVFEGGKKIAIQRGSGMCVIKSTKEKEYAAGIFLKWFTQPEQNLRFVSCTGYLPVTKEAYGGMMTKEIETVSDQNIKELLKTAIEMQQEYDFCIPPLFNDFDRLQREYETEFKKVASKSRDEYLKVLGYNANEAFNRVAITHEQARLILQD
ncbi:MAG: extracellular solute-binding protein [Desulfitobacteriaceae bacterium]|nr:extracellular solute-binding protein [Desulfitobacteriaceae bacterium]